MRWYLIRRTDNKPLFPNSRINVLSSHYDTGSDNFVGNTLNIQRGDGRMNPGALQIEFDLPVLDAGIPSSGAWLKIRGLDLRDVVKTEPYVKQLENGTFENAEIEVHLGMSQGLPFADIDSQGLAMRGKVHQAIGCWEGVEQHLQFNLIVSGMENKQNEAGKPLGIVWQSEKGKTVSQAIESALTAAGYTPIVHIKNNFVLTETQTRAPGKGSVPQDFFAEMKRLYATTLNTTPDKLAIICGGAASENARKVYVTDDHESGSPLNAETAGSDKPLGSKANPHTIKFSSIIGQPTWVEAKVLRISLAMNARIKWGDYIKLDDATDSYVRIRTSAGTRTGTQVLNKSLANNGVYHVYRQIRHIGNFRAEDASAWITQLDMLSAI